MKDIYTKSLYLGASICCSVGQPPQKILDILYYLH